LPRSPPIFIGAKVEQVQKRFAPVYGYHTSDFEGNFDGFLHDEGSFTVGNLKSGSISLPGHTPDSMGIIVGDCLFAGDSIFL
jgi:glyoxylase-like metal-dependent hydrolase (beta-lactamase superfamily II)